MMGSVFSLHSNPPHCLTIINNTFTSLLHFEQRTWSYFPRRLILERLDHWLRAADADCFRRPLQWSHTAEELHVEVPAIPVNFQSLPALYSLGTTTKIRILLSVSDALAHLHRHHFYMGFLVPEHIYADPSTAQVIMEIQPFPAAFPFIRYGLPDYPFSLFSRYSRNHTFSRVSDFHAFGVLLACFFTNGDQSPAIETMPASIAALYTQLTEYPESFLSADEISSHLRAELQLPPHYCSAIIETNTESLHPMALPVSEEQERQLRAFFRSERGRLIALLAKDEAARLDLYNRLLIEVIERNYFFNIGCKNLPLATISELVERTITVAFRFFPEKTSCLQRQMRKYKRILEQQPIGNDIIRALTEWLKQFFLDIKPMMEWQSFYYIFENCEMMDEDSQQVLIQFWQKYGHMIPELYGIFSGKQLPGLFPELAVELFEIGKKESVQYRRTLVSQLGRAEESLLTALTAWFVDHQIDFNQSRLILEKIIETGQIELTADGWKKTEQFCLDADQLSPEKLVAERLLLLDERELEMLRTFACFPTSIRASELFAANSLSLDDLFHALTHFSKLGVLQVYQVNSVYVPIDSVRLALYDLPAHVQAVYFQRALSLYFHFRPTSIAHLIELAMLAGNKRVEYFFLITYFRQVRHLLSLERRRAMLETIRVLQQDLNRTKILCWDRLLHQVCVRLNQYDEAEKLARSLYERTGAARDRFALECVLLFTSQVDLAALKAELATYMTDTDQRLSDRAYAAHLLAYVNFFSPLQLELASMVDAFYLQEVYPNRKELSGRLFAELSIIYTTLLYQYFPEREVWTSALRKKIESILELSFYHDLMIDLYNSYMFHNNVRIAHAYNQRQLEMARRYGFTSKWQIGHLNEAEISIYLGDTAAFRYHLEKLLEVDELKRADLVQEYLLHQLVFACEWQEWDLFQETEARILELDSANRTFYMWEIISRYIAYRFRAPLPPPTVWEQEDEYTLFIDALYCIESGHNHQALQLFQQSLEKNSTRMHTGWVYREMIELLLKVQPEEALLWLQRFEEFLKEYGYDLFLPDYYRLNAVFTLQNGNLQHSMLFMRRAANGYELIEKTREYTYIMSDLNRAVEPSYLQAGSPLLHEPFVQALIAERRHFLQQALDLQVIIQLSEQVTESLDLDHTFQRLTHALFEYFPVNHLSINSKLFYQNQRRNYSVSGLIDNNEILRYQAQEENEQKYELVLYQRAKQQITLEVYSQSLTETKRLHMEHFLSFIKPHIANALLYMEMMIDNLTGFYQRRYFMEKLATEFALSNRYNLGLSLIMMDIDNFRLVNEHGHQEGDKVLRELAEIVRGVLRKNDIPGRYGGEELLLILPKTDGQEALKIARELRKQIEEEFMAGRPYKVTVSVGVSSLDLSTSRTVDDLIRAADDAEITAKTSGKNRVVAAWQQEKTSFSQ